MPDSLSITRLSAGTLNGKELLSGVSLAVKSGERHAVMGPNGAGKSTLAHVLMGHPEYQVTRGKIILNGKDITGLSPDSRAKLGLFLGFQSPVAVPGVSLAHLLRTAISENSRQGVSPISFYEEFKDQAAKLGLTDDLYQRSVNDGFSGGEKKKAEILQLLFLKPKFAILDEPDSGLDVDALKYVVKAIASLENSPGLLLITHNPRIFHYIKPDFVHILLHGKIIQSGNALLVKKIAKEGYAKYQ
jgi:Fe-S cluster assembly ATP-binding protein